MLSHMFYNIIIDISHNIISIILGYNRDKSKAWAVSQGPVSVSFGIISSAVSLIILSLFETASYSSVYSNYTYLRSLCVFCEHTSVCLCVCTCMPTHVCMCSYVMQHVWNQRMVYNSLILQFSPSTI